MPQRLHFVTSISVSNTKQCNDNGAGDMLSIFIGGVGRVATVRPNALVVLVSDLCDSLDLSVVCAIQFAEAFRGEIQRCFIAGFRHIVLQYDKRPEILKAACYLLGSYLIVEKDFDINRLLSCFSPTYPEIFECGHYKDNDKIKNSQSTISDCWRAMKRAADSKVLSTEPQIFAISLQTMSRQPFDLIHVIPTKLIVVRKQKLDDPSELLPCLESCGVTAIAELSAHASAPEHYQHHAACLEVQQLAFDGRPTPPPAAVSHFFRRVVDRAGGAVALVCGEDGPPGGAETLAALYLMRSHGFGARGAAAWVEMAARGGGPGPKQREYLRGVEDMMRARAARRGRAWPGDSGGDDRQSDAAEPGTPAGGDFSPEGSGDHWADARAGPGGVLGDRRARSCSPSAFARVLAAAAPAAGRAHVPVALAGLHRASADRHLVRVTNVPR